MITALTIFAVLVIGYLSYVFLAAYYEVRQLPKGPVFICNQHGPIHDNYLITFMGSKYCSICFHERSKEAEKIG